MSRILSPYGIDQKELKQHLINIGFIGKKYDDSYKNDFTLFNYNFRYNKKYETFEGKIYEIVEDHNYETSTETFYDESYYSDDQYNFVKYRKEDLEDKIYYSKNCLIDPYDNGSVYDDNMDIIDDGETINDNENDDDGYYDNDYDYRKKKY